MLKPMGCLSAGSDVTGSQANHLQRRKADLEADMGAVRVKPRPALSPGHQGESQGTSVSELAGGDDAEPSRPLWVPPFGQEIMCPNGSCKSGRK